MHHYVGGDLVVRKIEVGTMGNNVYVLECPETHEALVVDACFDPDAIVAGLSGANVVGIVQTHAHFDHIGALVELQRRLQVPVYAHPAETYPVDVDVALSDGDEIPFGKRRATVVFTPGHTPGGVCLLAGKHLVSGDTLFPGGPGNTRGTPQLFAQIIESITTKLLVLPDETVVYPGHGDDTTIGAERPQLAEWKRRGW